MPEGRLARTRAGVNQELLNLHWFGREIREYRAGERIVFGAPARVESGAAINSDSDLGPPTASPDGTGFPY